MDGPESLDKIEEGPRELEEPNPPADPEELEGDPNLAEQSATPVFDLISRDHPWPLLPPHGKIEWGVAHLHKGSEVYRRGGELFIVSPSGPYTSAGIRSFIRTRPGHWYRLLVRARLEQGDKAFVLAQDVTLTHPSPHRVKPVLGASLVPRKYFFEQNRATTTKEPQEYDLFFQARSDHTIIGLLFFRNFVSYRLAVTRFQCLYVGTDEGIYQRFPLLEPVSEMLVREGANETLARLAPYLRRFGLGPRIDLLDFLPLEIVSGLGLPRHHQKTYVPAYLAQISLGNQDKGSQTSCTNRSYLYLPSFTLPLDPEILEEAPYLLQMRPVEGFRSELRGMQSKRCRIRINGDMDGTFESRWVRAAGGAAERSQSQDASGSASEDANISVPVFLVYRRGYRTFYPRLELGPLCLNTTNPEEK